ncbi:MAG: hypothetical protein ABEK36_02775 [Candidatus Aenigmatarchaeota archaeon]
MVDERQLSRGRYLLLSLLKDHEYPMKPGEIQKDMCTICKRLESSPFGFMPSGVSINRYRSNGLSEAIFLSYDAGLIDEEDERPYGYFLTDVGRRDIEELSENQYILENGYIEEVHEAISKEL